MPWRLIIFIAIFAVFLAFITFNLENRCDISFGFTEITEVPVFVTIFASFTLGLICALPLVLHIKKERTGKGMKPKKNETLAEPNIMPEISDVYSADSPPGASEKIRQDAAAARKRFFSRKHGG